MILSIVHPVVIVAAATVFFAAGGDASCCAALAADAPRRATAGTQLSSGWEFSCDGETWKNVCVPHDWAISGPFDKTNDIQIVAIAEDGEKKASEKTGRSS